MLAPGNSSSSNSQPGNRYTQLRIKNLFTQYTQRQKEIKKQQQTDTPVVGKLLPTQTEIVKKVTETHQEQNPLFTSTSSFLSNLEQNKPQTNGLRTINLREFQKNKSLFDTPYLRLKKFDMQGRKEYSAFYRELETFLKSEDPKLQNFLKNDLVQLSTENGVVRCFRSFMYLESLMCELHDNGVVRKDNSSQTTRMMIFKDPAFIIEYMESIKKALSQVEPEAITPDLCLKLGMQYWAIKQGHFLGDIYEPHEAAKDGLLKPTFETRMEKLLAQSDDPGKLELEIKMFLAIKAYQNSAKAPDSTSSSLFKASEIFCLPSFTEFAEQVGQNTDLSSENILKINQRFDSIKQLYSKNLTRLGIEKALVTRVIEKLSVPVAQSLRDKTNGLKQKNTREIDSAYGNAFGRNLLPQNLALALRFFQTIEAAGDLHDSKITKKPFDNIDKLISGIRSMQASENLEESLKSLLELDDYLSRLFESSPTTTTSTFNQYVAKLHDLQKAVNKKQHELQEEKNYKDATAENAPSRNKMKLFLGIGLEHEARGSVVNSLTSSYFLEKGRTISQSFKGISLASSQQTESLPGATRLEEADHKALLPFRDLAIDLLLFLDHGTGWAEQSVQRSRPKSAALPSSRPSTVGRMVSEQFGNQPVGSPSKEKNAEEIFKQAITFSPDVKNLKENYRLILADPLVQKLFERLGSVQKQNIKTFINKKIIEQKIGELARLSDELQGKRVSEGVFNFLSAGVFQCREGVLMQGSTPSLRLQTRINALEWLLKTRGEKISAVTNDLDWMKDTIQVFAIKPNQTGNKAQALKDAENLHNGFFDNDTTTILTLLKKYLETMQSLLEETGWETTGGNEMVTQFSLASNTKGQTFNTLIGDFQTKFKNFAEQMTTVQMAVSNQLDSSQCNAKYTEPHSTCRLLTINTPESENEKPYEKLGDLTEIQKAKDSVKRDLWKICSSLTGIFLNPDDVANCLLADLKTHEKTSLFVDINNRPLFQLFDKDLQETILGLIYNYHALSFIEKNITDENRPLIERYQTYGYADFKQRFDHRVHALVGGILLLNQQDEHDRFLASTKQELGIREFSNVLPGKIKQFIASAGAGKTVLVQRLKWYLANLGVQKTLLITPIPLGDVRKYSSQESSQSDGPNPLRWVSLQAFNADRSRFLEEYKDGLIICDEMDVKGPTRFDSYNEFKDELRAQNNYRVVEMSGTKNLAGLVLDLLGSLRAEMEHEMDLVKNIEALAKKYPQLLSQAEQLQLNGLNTKRSSQTDFEAIMDFEREKRDILNPHRFIEKLNRLNQQQLSPSSSQNDLSSMKQSRSRRVLPSAVSKAELESQIKKLSEDVKRLDDAKKSLVDTQAAIREMLDQMTKFFCNSNMSIDSYQLIENRETHLDRFKAQFREALEQTRKFREGQNDVTASIQNYYFTSTPEQENSLSINEIISQVQNILKPEEKICLEIKDDQGVTKYYLVESSTYKETTLDQMKVDKKILRCCIYLFNQERGVDFDEDSNNAFVKYRSIVFPKDNNELSRALQMHGRTRLASRELETHVYYALENGTFQDTDPTENKINQILQELLNKILRNVDTISTDYTLKKVDELFDKKIKTGFDEWVTHQTNKYLSAESFSSSDMQNAIQSAMDDIRASSNFAQALHNAKLDVAKDVAEDKFQITSVDFEIEGLPQEKSVFFAKTYWDEIYKRAWGNLEKDFLVAVRTKKSVAAPLADLNKVLYTLFSTHKEFNSCIMDPVGGVKTILESYAALDRTTSKLDRIKAMEQVKAVLLAKSGSDYTNLAFKAYYSQILGRAKQKVRDERTSMTPDSLLGISVRTHDNGKKYFEFETNFINQVQKNAEDELDRFLKKLLLPSSVGGENVLNLNLSQDLKGLFADSLLDRLITSLEPTPPQNGNQKEVEKITIDKVLASQASKKQPNPPALRQNLSQSVLTHRVLTRPTLSESPSQAPQVSSNPHVLQSYIDMCDVYPYFLSQELSKVLSTSLIDKLNTDQQNLETRISDFQNSLLSNLRVLMHVIVNKKELQMGKNKMADKLRNPSQTGTSAQQDLMSTSAGLIKHLANKFCKTHGDQNAIYTALTTQAHSIRVEI